jgi:hypothetical protein
VKRRKRKLRRGRGSVEIGSEDMMRSTEEDEQRILFEQTSRGAVALRQALVTPHDRTIDQKPFGELFVSECGRAEGPNNEGPDLLLL